MIDLIRHTENGVDLYIRQAVADAERMIVHEVQVSYAWDFEIRHAIDVGAHIGSWSLYAKQRHPQAQIAAIEVDALNMLMLRLNMFDVPGVTLYEARCGYDAGDYVVGRHRYNSGSTRVISQASLADAQQHEPYLTFHAAPPVITLEQVMHDCHFPALDVLKLDCEGAEVEIINHMQASTIDSIQHIVGEVHTLPDIFERQTHDRLKQHGFQVMYTPHPANPNLNAFHAWR